jgi:hypothetical protein
VIGRVSLYREMHSASRALMKGNLRHNLKQKCLGPIRIMKENPKAQQDSNIALMFRSSDLGWCYWQSNKPGYYSQYFKDKEDCIAAVKNNGYTKLIIMNGFSTASTVDVIKFPKEVK